MSPEQIRDVFVERGDIGLGGHPFPYVMDYTRRGEIRWSLLDGEWYAADKQQFWRLSGTDVSFAYRNGNGWKGGGSVIQVGELYEAIIAQQIGEPDANT
jgi:hypothetical protein